MPDSLNTVIKICLIGQGMDGKVYTENISMENLQCIANTEIEGEVLENEGLSESSVKENFKHCSTGCVRNTYVNIFIVLFFIGEIGCGRSESNSNTPFIKNYTYSPKSATWFENEGTIKVNGDIEFIDGDGNVNKIVLNIYNPTKTAITQSIEEEIKNVQNLNEGHIKVTVFVSTITGGEYPFEVYLKDSSGNKSNTITGVFPITGDTREDWIVTTVDTIDNVGEYSKNLIDSNNKIHIIYFDGSNSTIKYATNNLGEWIIQTLANSSSVFSSTIDKNNKIHICFYSPNKKDLKYMTNASGEWIVYDVESTNHIGEFNAIAIDSHGNAHIAYLEIIGATYDNIYEIKYATNSTGSWDISNIDFFYGTGHFPLLIDLDSNDKVHIVYTNLVLTYITNTSGLWTTEYIVDEGFPSFIATDSNNQPHIVYSGGGKLNYVTKIGNSWTTSIIIDDTDFLFPSAFLDSNNKLSSSYTEIYDYGGGRRRRLNYTTNISGSWTKSTVDLLINGDVGDNSSIGIDSNNKVHISYYDGTNGDIKYAYSKYP